MTKLKGALLYAILLSFPLHAGESELKKALAVIEKIKHLNHKKGQVKRRLSEESDAANLAAESSSSPENSPRERHNALDEFVKHDRQAMGCRTALCWLDQELKKEKQKLAELWAPFEGEEIDGYSSEP